MVDDGGHKKYMDEVTAGGGILLAQMPLLSGFL